MPKKKKTVDTVVEPKVAEIAIEDHKSTVEGESDDTQVKLTPEEMEKKKEEIKHAWAGRIMLQIYRHQVLECINYMLNHRISIDDLRSEITNKKANKNELHSASRDFIMKIDPVAFVELAKMVNPNIDFSDKYEVGDKLLVRTSTNKEEEVQDGAE